MIKLDTKGKHFRFSTFNLAKDEFAKIISEINSNYDSFKGKEIAFHASVGLDNRYYIYYFENHGFNDYNIFNKFEI